MPITEFCDEQKLSTRDRLRLFLDVSQAVQHAHQKGIIHRDLKPSNVMVTMHDVKVVPKVIDFGVAKALSQPLTEKTLYTAYGQMVGTPLYMSPEQAQMSDLDVDTRSNIYSLGVLLYELLTGTTPFDQQTLEKAGLDEMRRIIREDEPLQPSDRISTLQAERLSTVADRRGIEPPKLGQSLRGELDWIVMKALDKDRTRRYETANGFGSDIERYLNDEPVTACPPSAWYRFRKFARRNKVAFTTTTLVAAAFVLGTAVSTWQAVRATAAENAARVAQTQAQRERDRAVDAEQRAKGEAQNARAAESVAKNERDRAREALVALFRLGIEFQRAGQDEQALAAFSKALEACHRAGKWSEGPALIFVGAFDFKRRKKYTEAEQLFTRLVQLHEEWGEPGDLVLAHAYRQELESVHKLMKSAPPKADDVEEVPKKPSP